MKKSVRERLKQLRIFEDVLSDDQREELGESLSRHKWGLAGGGDISRFWHMIGLEEEEFYAETMFDIIKNLTGWDFKIKRIYANGQTACQNGVPHFDDTHDQAYTFIYWPNPRWERYMAGNLVFLNQLGDNRTGYGCREYGDTIPLDVEIAHVIGYKPNRGIFFPSNIAHYAEAPDRKFDGLRISVAFKIDRILPGETTAHNPNNLKPSQAVTY